MQSFSVIVLIAVVGVSQAAPGLLYAALGASVADTKVFRDYLGNQATSYAYQDGHSSTVALSRNDVSKHLVAAPVAVPAPVAYAAAPAPIAYAAAPAPVAYAAPVAHHVAAPVYTASSYQYHHRAYPSYAAYAAPGYVY